MTPIHFEPDPLIKKLGIEKKGFPAKFFIRLYPKGYKLGIAVRAWWWEKVKRSCASPLNIETDPRTGSVELTLAALPHCEFDIYWRPVNWNDDSFVKAEQIVQRRDQGRHESGWIAKDLSIPELGSTGVPQHIEHKYFVVEHRYI